MSTTTSKCCATCEYWDGLRQVSRSNPSAAEYSTISNKNTGTCNAVRSSKAGKETRATDSCSQWTKWSALR